MYQSLNEYEETFLTQNQNKVIVSKPEQDYPNYPADSENNTTPAYATLSQKPDNIYAATVERRQSKDYSLLEGHQNSEELQDTYATLSKPEQNYPNYPTDSENNTTPGYATLSQKPDNIYAATVERRKSNDYSLLEGHQNSEELQDTYATLDSNQDTYASLEEKGSFKRKENTYQCLQNENNKSKYVGW